MRRFTLEFLDRDVLERRGITMDGKAEKAILPIFARVRLVGHDRGHGGNAKGSGNHEEKSGRETGMQANELDGYLLIAN